MYLLEGGDCPDMMGFPRGGAGWSMPPDRSAGDTCTKMFDTNEKTASDGRHPHRDIGRSYAGGIEIH